MIHRKSQHFCGNVNDIPCKFLGNQSKMESLYQEKEFLAGHMSGNEQLGNNSWETRGACKQVIAAHALMCRCTDASALSHLHSPHVETRLVLISRHASCNKFLFLVQKFHFQLIPQELQEYHCILSKRLGFPKILYVPGKDIALRSVFMARAARLESRTPLDGDGAQDKQHAGQAWFLELSCFEFRMHRAKPQSVC